jgi:hypothetical protein
MPNGKLEEAGAFVFNDGSVRNIGRDDDPNKEDYNKKKFVSYCSWSMFYLKRDAIEKVGLLDEGLTPLYYEDTDWQYRAHKEGFKIKKKVKKNKKKAQSLVCPKKCEDADGEKVECNEYNEDAAPQKTTAVADVDVLPDDD